MTEPRTDSGKRLAALAQDIVSPANPGLVISPEFLREQIAAIEQEAVAAALRDLEQAFRQVVDGDPAMIRLMDKALRQVSQE